MNGRERKARARARKAAGAPPASQASQAMNDPGGNRGAPTKPHGDK